ncbi:MAG TPA: hypothetical protein DIC30_07770 [Oceanospirillales bacterium]|nr:hypothetical protein [Oceanospirillales bacterium]|tara:strand:- start:2895 stop:3908 length:1014 start_codon:yes stop_codon:yes gene_type:complete
MDSLLKAKLALSAVLTSTLLLSACGGSSSVGGGESSDETLIKDVDTSLFAISSLESLETVECTLSNGETSTCYEITIKGFPADRDEVGPYCPETISTTAENSGKWFDNGILHDADGEFISNLATFYNDDNWQLFDANTDEVYVTDTQAKCEAAAVVDVAEEYNNYCVECDINYYSEVEGEGLHSTVLIPTTPILSSEASDIGAGGVGVAFNGVVLDAAAPAEVILEAYTIAAFDDCVGHVNPFAGYHYHGANHGDGSCPGVDFESDGHAGAFGYALDGFAVYSMLDENGEEEDDLDECRGHSDDTRGYHYHTAGPGENSFIGCFTGVIVQEDERPRP